MVTRVRGCPHCAQTIHVDAKICQHCRGRVRKSWLDLFAIAVATVAIGGFAIAFLSAPAIHNAPSSDSNATVPATDDMKADYAYQAEIILRSLQGCRGQQMTVAAELRAGDVYRAYDAAQGGQAVCEQARKTIEGIAFDAGLDPSIAARLKAGLDDCSTALFTRAQAMGIVAKGADSGFSPSLVASVRDKFGVADSLETQCTEAIGTAARDGGLITEKAWPDAAPVSDPALQNGTVMIHRAVEPDNAVVIYTPPSPTPTPYIGPVIPHDQDANYAQPADVANEQ